VHAITNILYMRNEYFLAL